MSQSIFKGVIHGKTIELDREPNIPNGEAVTVAVQRDSPAASSPGPVPSVESWCQRIVFDSTISPTEKVVKGTRLLAEQLLTELLLGGKSDEEFLKAHPELTPEDVAALRNFGQTPVGLRRSFGGWAEDALELDKYLEWTRQNRKIRRREFEE